jgi:hypothetical protein
MNESNRIQQRERTFRLGDSLTAVKKEWSHGLSRIYIHLPSLSQNLGDVSECGMIGIAITHDMSYPHNLACGWLSEVQSTAP